MLNVCIVLAVSWVLLLDSPFSVACLFFQFLMLITLYLGASCNFLSFVMFIVYAGGLMVLISYCVMLLPPTKMKLTFFPLLFFSVPFITCDAFIYGLYSSSIMFLIGFVLFLILLCVVEIVDYSIGMMNW